MSLKFLFIFWNQAICNIIPSQQKEHLFPSLQHSNPQAQLQLLKLISAIKDPAS